MLKYKGFQLTHVYAFNKTHVGLQQDELNI